MEPHVPVSSTSSTEDADVPCVQLQFSLLLSYHSCALSSSPAAGWRQWCGSGYMCSAWPRTSSLTRCHRWQSRSPPSLQWRLQRTAAWWLWLPARTRWRHTAWPAGSPPNGRSSMPAASPPSCCACRVSLAASRPAPPRRAACSCRLPRPAVISTWASHWRASRARGASAAAPHTSRCWRASHLVSTAA